MRAGDGSHGLGRSRALVRMNVKLIVIGTSLFFMRQCGTFVASGVRPQLPSSIGSLHGLAGMMINALSLAKVSALCEWFWCGISLRIS